MNPHPITPRQAEFLSLVIRHLKVYGRSPDHQWMASQLGLSVQTIPQYYARLEEKGFLKKFPYGGVEVLKMPDGTRVEQVTKVKFVVSDNHGG